MSIDIGSQKLGGVKGKTTLKLTAPDGTRDYQLYNPDVQQIPD